MVKHKYNIILDLDQTLISGEVAEDFKNKSQSLKDKMAKYKFHNMHMYYVIFERPHLQKFLDYLFSHFNVSVWTAASKDYALFIIENIIVKNRKDRKLDWIFFSTHCSMSKKNNGRSKNLKMLWDKFEITGYDESNTFILDDNDEVCGTQPENCIQITPFEFFKDDSHKDKYLKNLKISLENHSNHSNIRDIIKNVKQDMDE